MAEGSSAELFTRHPDCFAHFELSGILCLALLTTHSRLFAEQAYITQRLFLLPVVISLIVGGAGREQDDRGRFQHGRVLFINVFVFIL